ncbi:unnamed protein product [Pseudo-nitzschia multistriata]|uniref:Uncharacterized protein n=1 Tax=Pseudo-nitzschia multistriata TaxID=183589 RepID=A0A448Z9D9_9STRA|nr:unnamed protein product [Pseudo-nitzschia multistriata]
MAAILCTTIGDLISKCCSAMTVPCEACGKGCNELGKLCGKGCSEFGNLMCTPFMPYIAVTFMLNTPSVVYAIKSAQSYGCSYSLFRWLVVNAAFAVSHMVAALYIVKLIQEPTAAETAPETATINATTGLRAAEEGQSAQGTNNNFYVLNSDEGNVPGGANSFKRIKYVLCYDKGMAVYIVIFLTWVVWMGIGVSRRLFSGDANDDYECDEMLHFMNLAIAVGYVWMGLVGTAFCCSLCCLR